MNPLVTLGVVKQVLHIDHTDDDATLTLLIAAASQKVRDYLKGQFDTVVPDELSPPPEIQLATITLVGTLYREPDGNEFGEWSLGNMPQAFTSLLWQYRDPALR